MNPALIWLPRDLHPVAWWGWAIGLAVVASSRRTSGCCCSSSGWRPWWSRPVGATTRGRVVPHLCRAGRGASSSRGWPSGSSSGAATWVGLLDLPEVPLPGWALGVHLLGPVTRESLLFALYDGLRLGTIVICVGAANSLANPKRLLRSMPAALYEVGTALVVAITILPAAGRQPASRPRRPAAARWRHPSRRRSAAPGRPRPRGRPRTLPALAAGMDARGYGRATGLTPGRRRATGGLMLAGLCGLCVGTYAVLDRTAPRVLALPMLAVGVAVALTGLVGAGSRVTRSRYRPDTWRLPEWLVLGSGVVAASIAVVARRDLLAAYPPSTPGRPSPSPTCSWPAWPWRAGWPHPFPSAPRRRSPCPWWPCR